MSRYYDNFRPYVSVGARRAKAEKLAKKLAAKGQKLLPVEVSGRLIAKSFWGKAWCENLESYSDFANRLPRGRTYVRNGSVIDLQIAAGKVEAMVSGSEIYKVKIGIQPVATKGWTSLKRECAGQIGSLLELLGGKLSTGVMTVITRPETGLFPKPVEIKLSCSCPDWADMCKHVAAALYGIGARLDERPELLFLLRDVNHEELIGEADAAQAIGASGEPSGSALGEDDLSSIFGIDMDDGTMAVAEAPPVKKTRPSRKKKASGSVVKAKRPSPKSRQPEPQPAAPVRRKRTSPTSAQVRRILAAAATGQSSLAISRDTGVGYAAVLRIVKGAAK